jgi:glycosyltransferase involved in cell wall biosynthesis
MGFIGNFSRHSADTVQQANALTAEALSRSRLAIFSSDWAARSAIELYGTSKEKVRVVPFGANINCQHQLADIRDMLKRRLRNAVKLLFLGKEWDRKGGDIVLKVAKALHAAGQRVELHLVGCTPPKTAVIPDYVYCHGYVSKQNAEGVEKITRLLSESHFLFVPSRAEAFGIVFCEANAFGLPCLTSYVGGIGTIVRDNVNGMTFSLNAKAETYCSYIMDLMQDYGQYESLALSSFNEYQTRLNWGVATKAVKEMIAEII